MLPGLREGDRLLVQYGAAVRPGCVVVATLPGGVVGLKRVEAIDAAGVWLVSDNSAEGWDSRRHQHPVAPIDVFAVARLRFWPWPRVLRSSIP